MCVREPGGPLLAETTAVESPPPGHVRIQVGTCGVCHADIGTAAATSRNVLFPVTPGHEIAGSIAEVAAGITGWAVGD